MNLIVIRRFVQIRYSIRTLVCLLAFAAFACFWITWPQRAGQTFAEEYFARLVEESPNPYRPGTQEAEWFETNHRGSRKRELKPLVLVAHRRSWLDLLLSRQTFDCRSHEFTIVRGKATGTPIAYFESGYRYYR